MHRILNPRILNPRIGCPRIDNPRIGSPRISCPRIGSPRIWQSLYFTLEVILLYYFRFFQNLAKLQFTVWAPEAPGALWTPWVPESTWAPWSFHAGVDDVDKKVD